MKERGLAAEGASAAVPHTRKAAEATEAAVSTEAPQGVEEVEPTATKEGGCPGAGTTGLAEAGATAVCLCVELQAKCPTHHPPAMGPGLVAASVLGRELQVREGLQHLLQGLAVPLLLLLTMDTTMGTTMTDMVEARRTMLGTTMMGMSCPRLHVEWRRIIKR